MSEMKERILRTALKLFAQEGYEAVSISRIAGALGLSKGALYRHYRDKRDVLDSIVREMERRDAEGAQEYALPGAEDTEAMAARRKEEIEAAKMRAEQRDGRKIREAQSGTPSERMEQFAERDRKLCKDTEFPAARDGTLAGGSEFSAARDRELPDNTGFPAAQNGELFNSAEFSAARARDDEPFGGAEFSRAQREELPDCTESSAVTPRQLTEYARRMVRYWTQDEFAADFRRMLTLEQYRDPEMARMLQQYLTIGPMEYTALLLENMGVSQARERAAALYGGMYMLICASDGAEDAGEYIALADAHLERMRRELERECAGIS